MLKKIYCFRQKIHRYIYRFYVLCFQDFVLSTQSNMKANVAKTETSINLFIYKQQLTKPKMISRLHKSDRLITIKQWWIQIRCKTQP